MGKQNESDNKKELLENLKFVLWKTSKTRINALMHFMASTREPAPNGPSDESSDESSCDLNSTVEFESDSLNDSFNDLDIHPLVSSAN